MLGVREEHIPGYGENTDVKNSIGWWDEQEVDELTRWPHSAIDLDSIQLIFRRKMRIIDALACVMMVRLEIIVLRDRPLGTCLCTPSNIR